MEVGKKDGYDKIYFETNLTSELSDIGFSLYESEDISSELHVGHGLTKPVYVHTHGKPSRT
jgi:hypothetical protein